MSHSPLEVQPDSPQGQVLDNLLGVSRTEVVDTFKPCPLLLDQTPTILINNTPTSP